MFGRLGDSRNPDRTLVTAKLARILRLGCTIVFRVTQFGALLIDPRFNSDKISHKRWNRTLEHCRIALDHILHQNIGAIKLINN